MTNFLTNLLGKKGGKEDKENADPNASQDKRQSRSRKREDEPSGQYQQQYQQQQQGGRQDPARASGRARESGSSRRAAESGQLGAPKDAAVRESAARESARKSAAPQSQSRSGTTPYQFRDSYHLGKKLGEGAFGIVHLCRKKGTDTKFAVKLMEMSDAGRARDAEREALMMRRFKHPNVVSMVDHFRDKWFHYIVMEWYAAGDLVDVVQTHLANGKLQDSTLSNLFKQMLQAILHLHSQFIIHRDVKADNFLLDRFDIFDKECRVVLSDMGTAIQNPDDKLLSRPVGTKIYWSPEVVRRRYSFPADVWAIGIILYGIVNGSFPFRDEKQILERDPILKGNPNMSKPCLYFLSKLLDKREANRPTAEEALTLEWIVGGEEFVLNADLGMQIQDLHVSRSEEITDGNKERRRRLLELMNGNHHNKHDGELKRRHSDTMLIENFSKGNDGGAVANMMDIFGFTTTSGPQDALKEHQWQWQEKYKLGYQLGSDSSKVKQIVSDQFERATWSPDQIKNMFAKYSIDTSKFGKGLANNYTGIAKEIIAGECSFGEVDNQLVRVVEVVLVRIMNRKEEMLVETKILRRDGEQRDTRRLPGTKKRPTESTKQTAERVLSEYLRMDPRLFQLSPATEKHREEEESPAYPGFKTIYIKHFVDAQLMRANGSRVTFSSREEGFIIEDLKGDCRYWRWTDSKECDRARILTRGTKTTTADVSEFMAPVVDAHWTTQLLKDKLEAYKINTDKFGKNSALPVEHLVDELNKGQCSLMEDNYELLRVVDVVLLRIEDVQNNRILTEYKTKLPDGRALIRNRLPGQKKNPNEGVWRTVQRALDTQLGTISKDVTIPVQYDVEESIQESVSFPGLKCVYRKYFFNCQYDPNKKKDRKFQASISM